WPLTFSVIIRSTAPAAVGWPCTVVVRNRYAADDAAAPAAMTPLMKLRLENESCVSSDICLSSIAGSPRRTGVRSEGEGFCPSNDNPDTLSFQRVFIDFFPRCRGHGYRFQAPPRRRRTPGSRRLRPLPRTQGIAVAQLAAATRGAVVDRHGGPDARASGPLRLPAEA